MPNGTYGGVRGKGTKVGQKSFVSRPTRFYSEATCRYFSMDSVTGPNSPDGRRGESFLKNLKHPTVFR